MTFLVEKDRVQINTQTGNYTLTLEDGAGMVEMNSGGATTITVPTNASVSFPIGTQVVVVRKGAGTVDVVSAVGVTINSVESNTSIASQYAGATLVKVATDEWYLFGDLN